MDDRIANAFFSEFNRLIEESSDSLNALKNQNSQWGKKYIFEVIISVIELTEFQKEVELILSGFEAKPVGFFLKTVSIDELILAVKMYLIAWFTINDLTARLINTVFDLGIHESDVSFGTITRNRKVANSKIIETFKKYQKELNIDDTVRARHDAVHRAKITDPELKELKAKRNRIESQRYSWLAKKRISEDEYNKQKEEFYKELKKTADSKKKYYRDHYDRSVTLLAELATHLARVAFDNLNEKRI